MSLSQARARKPLGPVDQIDGDRVGTVQYSGARHNALTGVDSLAAKLDDYTSKIVAVSSVVERVSEFKKMFTLVEASEAGLCRWVSAGDGLWPGLAKS